MFTTWRILANTHTILMVGFPEMIGQGFLAKENFAGLAAYLFIVLVTIVVIVIFTEAHRRVPVQYARSVFRGGRMYRQSGTTHIPLRVNSAGMIPPRASKRAILQLGEDILFTQPQVAAVSCGVTDFG